MSHRNLKDNKRVFSDSGVCMYICHDDLYHVMEL